MKELAIIVPSWNTRELLRACLVSCEPLALAGAEVIVVDDASADDSAAAARCAAPWATVLEQDQCAGFSAAVNRGWRSATGSFVLLLNADAQLLDGCAEQLLAYLEENGDCAAAAPRHLNPDGSTQLGVMAFPRLKTAFCFATPWERWRPRGRELRRYFLADWDHNDARDVEQPPASALLLRRAAVDGEELLDASMELFFSDVDLSRRLHQNGWRLHYLAEAQVIHERGASTSQRRDFVARWHGDRLTYYRKHFGSAAGVFVKACTAWAALDEIARRLGARLLRKLPTAPGKPGWGNPGGRSPSGRSPSGRCAEQIPPAFAVAAPPADTPGGAAHSASEKTVPGHEHHDPHEPIEPLLGDLYTFLRS